MKIAEIREKFPMYADVPDRELVNGLHKAHYSDMPYAEFLKSIDFSERADPTKDMSGTDKFLAGAGKAFVDVGRGVRQITGNAAQSEIDESKQLDKPLMETGAGIAGNIAGNAAMFAPTALIPGANTYTGAALVGAASGALQPVGEDESRLMNAGVGAGAGIAGQALGNSLNRVIKPVASRLSPEEQLLANAAKREGIPLTAGQATGSRPLQITESVMENLPLTSGSQIAQREAQQRAFTAAALRRGGMTGDVADAATLLAQKKTLCKTIGDVAERNTLDFNNGLVNKLVAIVDDATKHLPDDMAAKVATQADKVLAQVDQGGTMLGSNYQGWREPLRELSREAGTGRYFQQMRGALDDTFRAQLPGAEGDLVKEASRKYANTKTIIDAMGGPGNLPAKGQLSPAQLAAALSRSVGRENKALGVGDLNELAKVGQVFVRDQVPNSGTAQRQLVQSLLTGSGGAGIGAIGAGATGNDPLQGAMLGAGVTAAGLTAPKAVQALMNSGAGQAYLKQGIATLTPAQKQALVAALRVPAIASTPALVGQ